MSRRIGGQENVWGTATWSGPAGTGPFNGTWVAQPPSALSTLIASVLSDPDDGVPILGPGDYDPDSYLRFVVYVNDPTLDPGIAWGTAVWGTDEWSTSVGSWKDITARVRGLTWQQGQDSPGELPAVGTATITLDNRDGVASPWALSGEFYYGGQSYLRTGCLFRFGTNLVTDGVGDNYIPYFTGRIESIEEDTEQDVDGWLTITLVELSAELAAYPGEVDLHDGQTLSQSLLNTLEKLDWPYQTDMYAPAEDTLVMETALGGFEDAQYATTIMNQIAAGLHWAVLCDGNGKIRAVRRHIADYDFGYSFSNDPVPGPITAGGEVPLANIKPYTHTDRLLNQAQASRLGGATLRVTNEKSRKAYGLITGRYDFPRDDLVVQTDDDVLFLLERVTEIYGFDDMGIDQVELDMDLDLVNLPGIMDDLAINGIDTFGFRIRWVHPSGSVYGPEFVTITGVDWSFVMEGVQAKWTGTLSVERALVGE